MPGKKAISLICLLFLSFFGFGQQNPHVYWRFSNAEILQEGEDLFLVFDVEISCDKAATYHSDMQVYLNYNTLAFGENVVASGNIFVEKSDLMAGEFGSTPLYVTYPPNTQGADNQSYRHAILTEAQFPVPNPAFANEVPLLPEWGKLLHYKMRIQDDTQLAGIEFVPAVLTNFMNGGQYYVDQAHPSPTKYGDPPGYEGVYENNLMEFPLSISGIDLLENNGISLYFAEGTLFIWNPGMEDIDIRIFDLKGREVFQKSSDGEKKDAFKPELPGGFYVAVATSGSSSSCLKFLVRP